MPQKELEAVLSGIVNSKLGFAIMKKSNIKPHTKMCQISAKDIHNICDTLKSFEIEISGTKGFESAQITCGGIKTDEVNPKTMMSKIVDGLFMCGEILDIHGDCGGYNLHLAWTTGRIAGNAAYEYLNN
jgi:predicted Rossmann fold flavoprotein